MRWKSPELGFVSPLKFIKVAEDTCLIIPLGTWILRNACAFLTKLHTNGYTDLNISVNVSIVQLLQIDFNDTVVDILNFSGLDPNYLELEITESILMESIETIGIKLESLREIGVSIALDDFGTGYSSLNYLKQLPISTLKIDKSFIDEITCENMDDTLTGQIIMLGRSMGMSIVAEGVESREQLEYLINHKCHKIQGYIYSKPIPQDEIEKLLEINLVEDFLS
jgi:EAL domain-containing protein (putative c-di-GMP-specific phosphodiesterase class I)